MLNYIKTHALHSSDRTFRSALIGLVLVVDLLVMHLFALHLIQMRRTLGDRAKAARENLVQVLASDLEGLLREIDLNLDWVREEVERGPGASGPDLDVFIDRRLLHAPYLDSIRTTTAAGVLDHGTAVVQSPRTSVADRDHFQALRERGVDRLFIGGPVLARISGQWEIVFSKRLQKPGGDFAGVVLGHVHLERLERMLSLRDIGPHGRLVILGSGLRTLALYPAPARERPDQLEISPELRDQILASWREGTSAPAVDADGLERTSSFRRLAGYPLVVLASAATADHLGLWRKEVLQAGVALTLILLLTSISAVLLLRFWERRRQDQERTVMEGARDALFKISEATYAEPSLQSLFGRIHEIVAGLLPARNFYVAVLDPATGTVAFPYFVDEVDEPPAPRSQGNSLTDLVLRTGRPHLLTPVKLERLCAEGTVRIHGIKPIDWLGVPLKTPEGTFGVLAVQSYTGDLRYTERDVDLLQFVSTQIATSIHRKKIEEERAQLQVQLQHAQKMQSLGSLAGGIAHDMNNVLGAILLLASSNLEAQSPAHPAFATIAKAAIRGGKMVKSLLAFARKSPLQERELDLNALLREEARLLEHTTLARIHLVMDLEPGLRTLQGDGSALANTFMNLCINAVDAMPGAGTLTIRTRNLGEDRIEVRVEDTGTGMAPQVLERALEPFFTTKEMGKGTGLGLAMAYSTVKAHQGQLELESEPGRGTRVRMTFPASPAPAADPDGAGRPSPRAPRRAMDILLVDDDELIQSSIPPSLEGQGHRVVSAWSGEEAIEAIRTGLHPDLVVLDLGMPGLGGAGTLRHLRELRPAVPVLLATGLTDPAALELTASYPGVALLAKPFTLDDLLRQLEQVVH